VTRRELEEWWSLNDVMEANEVLTAVREAQRRADREAMKRK
jgi:hypothetical protein